jgi:hypothetical protein
MLVFAACDQRALEALEQATADYLAWDGICRRVTELNLDAHNTTRAEQSRNQASDAVLLRLAEAYQWALVPHLASPTGAELMFDALRLDSSGPVAERTSRKLVAEGSMQTQFPPVMLRLKLDHELVRMWEHGHVSVNELWEAFAKYPYLPRLAGMDVLVDTVSNGAASTNWEREGFATAAACDDTSGRYIGLETSGFAMGVAGTSLVVRPDVALAQASEPETLAPGLDTDDGVGGLNGGTSRRPGDDKLTTAAQPTRFAGVVTLSDDRPVRDFGQLTEELLSQFIGKPGTDVTIRVEVEASRPDGFDDATVRTVTENARTLKFDHHGFEAD